MDTKSFADKVNNIGGKAFLVGGSVRDLVINEHYQTNIEVNDRDYTITGLSIQEFEKEFPEAKKIGTESIIYDNGKATTDKVPVYLVEIDGESCEVALARNEKKIESEYGKFAFYFNKDTTIEEDLARRDITINSMAIDIHSGELIDPFEGVEDIKNKKIRAVFLETNEMSVDDFYYDKEQKEIYIHKNGKTYNTKIAQDPIRAIRAARIAAKLGFEMDEDTVKSCSFLKEDLKNANKEIIYEEIKKATLTDRPDLFLDALNEMNILNEVIPEVAKTVGVEHSPNNHPEGDVFEHTKQVSRAANVLTRKMFPNDDRRLEENIIAAFLHDSGKPYTQNIREDGKITFYNHESEGVQYSDNFIQRHNLMRMRNKVLTITKNHMYMHQDLSVLKPNRLIPRIIETYKNRTLNKEEVVDIKQAIANREETQNLKNEDDVKDFLKEKNQLNKIPRYIHRRLSLKSKEIVNSKKVDLKELNRSSDKAKYLKSKSMSNSDLEKLNMIYKEKNISNGTSLTDFHIVCTADTLGRLSPEYDIEKILKEAADMFHESKHTENDLTNKIEAWKNEHNLPDKYVNDFTLSLKNGRVMDEIKEINKEIKVNVNEELLLESGKDPDEIAHFKDQTKIKMIIKELNTHKKNSLSL